MTEQAGEVNIILDALDECQIQDGYRDGGLFPWMRSLLDSPQKNVRLFVTSRPEQHIKSAIEKWPDRQGIIPIQSCLVESDISEYIHTRVRDSQGLARWHLRPDIQSEIECALNEKAGGMFRWVTCQLDALENCLDPLTLRAALRSLPRTLDETYARTLSNLPQEHRHRTVLILQFLAYSERPLTTEEAVDAIALDANSKPRFDRQNRMPIPEEISRYCSSLVVVTKNNEGNSREITTLQLAHFSVKEYLMSDRLDAAVAEDFKEINARGSIAEVCLAYLLDLDPSLTISELREICWLAQYSARYWAENAMVAEISSVKVRSLLKEFFSNDDILKISYGLFDHDQLWRWVHASDEYEFGAPLYHASRLGLSYPVQLLLHNGADVNAEGGSYGSALLAASYGGHEKIVRMLLDQGADVNIKSGVFGTALEAASRQGEEKIVRMLLDHGGDANIESGMLGNALEAASYGGHENIVRMLLDYGGDVNIESGMLGNALEAASRRGHENVARVLLDAGADASTDREKDRKEKVGANTNIEGKRMALPRRRPRSGYAKTNLRHYISYSEP
ncbi:hypothetical protein PCL_02264 [Purpureocillium lilacinum]|uniref:Uncharacterized protein n=1 Tax=Purpureocillium lilacinum TaxID=33203 RepID=A0A2U3DNW9_PURLI|nr:hypothetical protein PCL_02264 [Purpureocillium lilacinum]